MNIIITGGTGLLGNSMITKAGERDHICATYTGEYSVQDGGNVRYIKLDIRDMNGYNKLFEEFKPQVIVHTASIGSPDFAEKNRQLTWDVNVKGTENIIKLCEKFGSQLIYISSNGIYDGERAPYSEESIAEPINYYGQTKLEGEKLLKRADIISAVVRPILMYGWPHPKERDNIVSLSIKNIGNEQKIFAYDDVYCNPLFVDSCAQCIWTMIEKDIYDSFNIAGSERISIYGLIKAAARTFGLNDSNILPVKQGYFNELVKRPQDTTYDNSKMRRVLGIEPLSVAQGLLAMKNLKEVK